MVQMELTNEGVVAALVLVPQSPPEIALRFSHAICQ